jgi:hypothetical protein
LVVVGVEVAGRRRSQDEVVTDGKIRERTQVFIVDSQRRSVSRSAPQATLSKFSPWVLLEPWDAVIGFGDRLLVAWLAIGLGAAARRNHSAAQRARPLIRSHLLETLLPHPKRCTRGLVVGLSWSISANTWPAPLRRCDYRIMRYENSGSTMTVGVRLAPYWNRPPNDSPCFLSLLSPVPRMWPSRMRFDRPHLTCDRYLQTNAGNSSYRVSPFGCSPDQWCPDI